MVTLSHTPVMNHVTLIGRGTSIYTSLMMRQRVVYSGAHGRARLRVSWMDREEVISCQDDEFEDAMGLVPDVSEVSSRWQDFKIMDWFKSGV